MKFIYNASIALAVILCNFQVYGQFYSKDPSRTEEQFCIDRTNKNFIKDLTKDSSNLMAFGNYGGLANGGVCWWHSRFQRNALYLTIFKPNLNRPTAEEANKLIADIQQAKKVVVIPGFNNFYEFSYAHQNEIQAALEHWQKIDGFVKFAWAKGLVGQPEVNPDKMKKIMDQIYEDVEINGNIAYNKLQIPGINAHSWLVVHMEKHEEGYFLEVLDSNLPTTTSTYRYLEGATRLSYYDGGSTFVPYLDQSKEMSKIKKTISKQCGQLNRRS